MKLAIFVVTLFSFVSCGISQQYSTSSKKAIKLFEEALRAPSQSIDLKFRTPNFRAGIELAEKALEKDPQFWEAHLLAAEFYEKYYEYKHAIKHYKAAIAINPNHTATGDTYFYLGNSQFATGDYEGAQQSLMIFRKYNNANPKMLQEASAILNKADFAVQAMKNPSKFNPINIGSGINTKDPEYFPTITVDGKTILFTRRITDKAARAGMQEDFYVSQLGNDGNWGEAVSMPLNINTENNEGAPSISADGRSLVFVACSDETGYYYGPNRLGKGSCDLFYTKRLGSRWLDPINLPGKVNTFTWESQPSLSADGKTLYFIRRVSKRGEPQNSDIFVSYLQSDGTWSIAKPLSSKINTPYMEESVYIHPDGKTLYFASRGHSGMGGSDLFMSKLDANGEWGNPTNLGYPINTKFDENSLLVGPTGDIAYFASNRDGGFGGLDIYYFELPENLRPTKTIYFEGIVFDATTKSPLEGMFELIDLKTGEQVVVSRADKVTGQFMVSLPLNRDYALNVNYPGYLFFSQNFNMTVDEHQEAFKMDVPMVRVDVQMPVSLKNVFFDLSKATLRKESHIELNKLVDFLNNNSRLKIEIGGHTDTRGDAESNLFLSQERANSVVEYLIHQGIDASRLKAKGYGESKPIISDAEIAKLNADKAKEEAHQSNRRTEYKIIP